MDKEQSYSELLESILNEELQEEELEELETKNGLSLLRVVKKINFIKLLTI